MAHLTERRSQNITGDFYVDRSCIDCDTCRWMAPEIFNRQDSQSAFRAILNRMKYEAAQFSAEC